ncbi:MAG TPA: alkaline phosphatase family protein [Armatimonadota bacterium]|nr:alkaline phosphatase family protein [Armatimonadota bacterium]
MRLLPSLRRTKTRLAVLGLDGVPHSFLVNQVSQGNLPNIAEILEQGTLRRIDSVYPTVSCVAWASFMTGLRPGSHGIYGFTDRDPGTYDISFPNADDLNGQPLWHAAAEAGRPSTVINVPMTHPPTLLQGLTTVAGFLAPRLQGATSPASLSSRLRGVGYRIDVDAGLAAEDVDAFLADASETLQARKRAAHLLMRDEWDLFVCHFMTTDRINHFLWADGEEQTAPGLVAFYQELDAVVGEIVDGLAPDDNLMILSDHGFHAVKAEVHLNACLREAGWLEVDRSLGKGLASIAESTRAFSMTPGRLYLNMEGREPRGSVARRDYDSALDELAEFLLDLKDPQDGTAIMENAYRGSELFTGDASQRAPDLLAIPKDGYDLKASFAGPAFRGPAALTGMHSYEDALVYVRGMDLSSREASIVDAAPTAMELLGEPIPVAYEGRSLLE